jgi:uncharacterized membrane protein
MLVAEYIAKALTVWWLGFLPMFEVYVAVATGLAMELDVVSAVVWGGLGNFTPIPLLLFGYGHLMQIPQFRAGLLRLKRRGGRKVERAFSRHGAWFLIPMTPILGSWAIALFAPVTGLRPRQVLLLPFISIMLCGIVTAVAIVTGVNWFTHR